MKKHFLVAVLGFDLKEKGSGRKEKLLEGRVLDGGDFRNLPLSDEELQVFPPV